MTSVVRANLVMIALVSVAACSQSTPEKPAESAPAGASQTSAEQTAGGSDMQKGVDDMAKGFEALARGMSAAAGTDAGTAPVDPVDFRVLQGLLPEMPGWERTKPSGERMTKPISYARASATFSKGDARIEQTITDSGFNQFIVAPFAMMLAAGYSKETDSGFEKATTVGGFPAYQKWDSADESGELTVMVAKRFVVEVKGRGVDDIGQLQAFLDRTDFKKLGDTK